MFGQSYSISIHAKGFSKIKNHISLVLIIVLTTGLFSVGASSDTVVAAPKPKLNHKKLTLIEGRTTMLKIKDMKKGSKIRWASKNKKIAVVTKSGKIRAKKPGVTVITAKAGKNKFRCKLRVKRDMSYGVFIGLNPNQTKKMKNYKTIVIDAEGFTKSQIRKLKKQGHIVYSYLNIGSVEKFRNYYKDFEDITLGIYEDWPDERWIDVSQKRWQDYSVNVLAKNLKSKGVDGFFIDNADIYYNYKSEKIYNGMCTILESLKKYRVKMIINGGDTFLSEVIKRKALKKTGITGVNQECVFTAINFNTGNFKKQTKTTKSYYMKHLAKCKKYGLSVFLTEYARKNKKKLRKSISSFSKKKKYHHYVSPTLDLTG